MRINAGRRGVDDSRKPASMLWRRGYQQRSEDSVSSSPDDGLSAIYIMSTAATAHFDRLTASAGSVGSCSVNISRARHAINGGRITDVISRIAAAAAGVNCSS